ncbi:hypothetical protein ACH5RR_021448 [Cinchona calisaya]|uniref:Uncharacterized protein n=1 Tax=Cinchona calisaya TaxID=153742 RepID=A0ABD2ZI91_9GENT
MGQQAVETEWAGTTNQAQFSPIGAETRKMYWNGRLSSPRDRTDSPTESPLLSRSFRCYIPYIANLEALSYLFFLLGFRPLKGRTKESCERRGVQNPKKRPSRSIPATLLTSLGEVDKKKLLKNQQLLNPHLLEEGLQPAPGKQTVIAAENKHAVPGDWNPLRSAKQADNRQKMLSKAAGLKSEADP